MADYELYASANLPADSNEACNFDTWGPNSILLPIYTVRVEVIIELDVRITTATHEFTVSNVNWWYVVVRPNATRCQHFTLFGFNLAHFASSKIESILKLSANMKRVQYALLSQAFDSRSPNLCQFIRGISKKVPEGEVSKTKSEHPKGCPYDCNNPSEKCQGNDESRRACREMCCSGPKGNVSVGIIGGGWAPMYAAFLLKQNRNIKRVHVIDMEDRLQGSIADMKHIDTYTPVKHFKKKCIADGLIGMDIIALMDEADFVHGKRGPCEQFSLSTNYVLQCAQQMVRIAPEALVAVCVHPVTATLPFVSEVYKFSSWWDPNRLLGSVAIDSMRIGSITANMLNLNPTYLSVPIAGGADACTVVPLLSKATPVNHFTEKEVDMLVTQLRGSDYEMADTDLRGPVLSTGTAVAKFVSILAAGISGHERAIASAFVRSNVLPFCQYLTTELHFGPCGVEANLGLPKISAKEIALIEKATPVINDFVEMAVNAAHCKEQKEQCMNTV